jgi:hypothetical protein
MIMKPPIWFPPDWKGPNHDIDHGPTPFCPPHSELIGRTVLVVQPGFSSLLLDGVVELLRIVRIDVRFRRLVTRFAVVGIGKFA